MFPLEIWFNIVSFIDDPSSLLTLSTTCHTLHNLVLDREDVWKHLIVRDYPRVSNSLQDSIKENPKIESFIMKHTPISPQISEIRSSTKRNKRLPYLKYKFLHKFGDYEGVYVAEFNSTIGKELIHVRHRPNYENFKFYLEDRLKLEGIKLTGSSSVPRQQRSFSVFECDFVFKIDKCNCHNEEHERVVVMGRGMIFGDFGERPLTSCLFISEGRNSFVIAYSVPSSNNEGEHPLNANGEDEPIHVVEFAKTEYSPYQIARVIKDCDIGPDEFGHIDANSILEKLSQLQI